MLFRINHLSTIIRPRDVSPPRYSNTILRNHPLEWKLTISIMCLNVSHAYSNSNLVTSGLRTSGVNFTYLSLHASVNSTLTADTIFRDRKLRRTPENCLSVFILIRNYKSFGRVYKWRHHCVTDWFDTDYMSVRIQNWWRLEACAIRIFEVQP